MKKFLTTVRHHETKVHRFLLLCLFGGVLVSGLLLPGGLRAKPVPLKDVKGKVIDTKGAALVGVSIIVKGTSKGTTTDAEGLFSLAAQAEDVIIFSYIGFLTKEVRVGDQTQLTITLDQDSKNLAEVVVVGYGTQKKVNLTGAVDQVTGEVLESRPITRVSQALQGMVGNLNITTGSAGGAPNATQSINIRGYTGLGTSSGPLIVIDGIQGGDINSVNPDDIENISILKDAASAAIYGSSAPYGVILITTKQGKKDKAPAITYSNNLAWAQPLNLPEMSNSLVFATLYNEAFVNAGRAKFFSDETIQRIKDYQAGTLATETIKSPVAGNNAFNSWNSANANNDWFKIYFRDFAFSQQHNLGVSGGSANSTYYVGLGFNQRGGMYNFGDDRYQRFNIRANVNTTLTKWLNFGLRTSVSRQAFNTPNSYAGRTGGNYMHQIARKFPTVALFNPDGNYSDASDVNFHINGGRLNQVTDQAMLTGEFNLNLAKGWTATANYTFDGAFYDESAHLKTLYHYLPDKTTSVGEGTAPNSFSRSNYRNQHHILNAYTAYEKTIGSHYFRALGGYVRDLVAYQGYTATNTQLYSDNVPSLSTTFGTSPAVTDVIRKLASEGFFGRINYNYKEKYLLEVNGRYDGTSRFLKDVRWKFYPGVSAGWNVDQEAFFSPLEKVVTGLKLRASYGALGDQSFLDVTSPNWYPFYPNLGNTRPTATTWLFGGAQQAAVTPPGLINNDLTWVRTTTLNLGADLSFLNNRLTSSFDWYVRKADNFAGPAQALPAIMGANPPSANNAAIETRGFELMVQWNDKIGDVSYRLRGVLSDYQGKVTRYPNPTKTLSTFYEGMKMGEIWGYTTMGLFQSDAEVADAPSQAALSTAKWSPGDVRYADLNGDGKIDFGNNTATNPGDQKIIGNNTPRYSYGFTGDVSWKGFDLMLFIQGVAKREAWSGSNYFWGIVGNEWQSSFFTVNEDRWTPETPGGYFPKYYMSTQNNKNTQTQTRYLQNAAYLRIKNLQLGYTLPRSVLNKMKFNKVRVYGSIENLATVTKLIESLDPELFINDSKIYPLQRTFSCGINLSF